MFWRVEEAVRGARSFLTAAEAAVNATGAEGLLPLAACIARSLSELRDAVFVVLEIVDVEIEIPDELDAVLELLRGFGGNCPDEVSDGQVP